jgi:hypothetical protein
LLRTFLLERSGNSQQHGCIRREACCPALLLQGLDEDIETRLRVAAERFKVLSERIPRRHR